MTNGRKYYFFGGVCQNCMLTANFPIPHDEQDPKEAKILEMKKAAKRRFLRFHKKKSRDCAGKALVY